MNGLLSNLFGSSKNSSNNRSSAKRGVDTRIRFSIEPLSGDDAFQQWRDAMRAVARLPQGIPPEFRKKVWLALADKHIFSLRLDWEKTRRFAFNERSNPDDNKLGLQIVKDLHRTGCSGFSGHDNEEDRAVLKRVLLAYARWNKQVGYCQGFNVLAALILDVMDRKEEDALKVMIFLVDFVLPDSYFANNLRALSVDMAVFRDLLRTELPKLSRHLDGLQAAARDHNTGANYEPPLTNVFTMQWFLTLFATCLPKATALRVWDSVLLEGSEVLLRTALAIWGRLQGRIMTVPSADEFYATMGTLTTEMLDADIIDADDLIKAVYSMGLFPVPQLAELREKYTYNITPFSAAMETGQRPTRKGGMNIFSDDDELDEDDMVDNINCFAGMLMPLQQQQNQQQPSPNRITPIGESDRSQSGSAHDISKVSPGAYAATPVNTPQRGPSAYMERMTMDIDMLQNQYNRLRTRQKQAHIILSVAVAKHNAKSKSGVAVAPIESPMAVNHLFLRRHAPPGTKNRHVTVAPSIAPLFSKGDMLAGANLISEVKVQEVSNNKSSKPASSPSRESVKDDQIKKNEGESQEISVPNGKIADGLSSDENLVPSDDSKRDRHNSGQSSDGYQSEASNNTRGSSHTELDSSDSDTVPGDAETGSLIDLSDHTSAQEADLNDNVEKERTLERSSKDDKECDIKEDGSSSCDINNIPSKVFQLEDFDLKEGETPTLLQLSKMKEAGVDFESLKKKKVPTATLR